MKNKIYHTYQSQQFAGKVQINPQTNKRAIVFNNHALYQHFLDHTCKINDDITLNITNKRPKRTERQERYYFLYLSLISLSCGHSVEELHVWVKGKFLSKGITEVFGDKVRVVKSTKDLNVSEFIELLERIETLTGIPLPDTAPFLEPISPAKFDLLKKEQRKIYSKLVMNVKIPVN